MVQTSQGLSAIPASAHTKAPHPRLMKMIVIMTLSCTFRAVVILSCRKCVGALKFSRATKTEAQLHGAVPISPWESVGAGRRISSRDEFPAVPKLWPRA